LKYPDDAELAAWVILGLVRSHEEATQPVEESKLHFADDPWQQFAVAAAMMWNREYDLENEYVGRLNVMRAARNDD